jgi:hypothetical protein
MPLHNKNGHAWPSNASLRRASYLGEPAKTQNAFPTLTHSHAIHTNLDAATRLKSHARSDASTVQRDTRARERSKRAWRYWSISILLG